MALEIDIRSCSKDPETCPVITRVLEIDAFCEVTQDVYPDAETSRDLWSGFVEACCEGRCPGQHLEHAKAILSMIIEREASD